MFKNCVGARWPQSPHAILTAPNFLCMSSGQVQGPRHQRALGHASKTVGEYGIAYEPGCGCCSTKPSRLAKQAAARKAFRFHGLG